MSAAPIEPEDVILVGGEALYDLVYDGDDDLQGHPGGAAFNTARTIARLGQPVAYLGRLSTDRFGTSLERMLAADGVRLDAVVRTDEPTTLALAELDETGSATLPLLRARDVGPRPDARGGARRAAPRRRDPARRHARPHARADRRAPLEAVVEELSGQALVMVDPNCRPWVIGDADGLPPRACGGCSRRSDVVKVSEEDLAWLDPQRSAAAAARMLLAGRARASCCSPAAPTASLVVTARATCRSRPRGRGRRHDRRGRRVRRRLPGLVARAGPRRASELADQDAVVEAATSAPRRGTHRRARGASPPFLHEVMPATDVADA